MANTAGLPESGFVRPPQIIGDPKAKPPVPAIIPIGKSTWWAGVSDATYPKSVKLSARTTAWRVEDIRELIARMGAIEGGAIR
jgi:prophage regulatory protein